MNEKIESKTDDWDAIARRLWPVRAWLSRRPRVLDWLVVVICAGVPQLAASFSGERVSLLSIVITIGTALALLWRRGYPFMTLVAVVVVSSVGELLLPHSDQSVPFAFALYAVASLQGIRPALVGYVIGMLASAGTAFLAYAESATLFSPVILDPAALLGLMAGLTVRSQRQRNAVLSELWNERSERARVTERAKIAADMHDVVSHSISTMIALSDGAASAWSMYPERSASAMRKISAIGRDSLNDMSKILRLLPDGDADHSVSFTESGTSQTSLDDLIENFRATGMPVRLTRQGDSSTFAPAVQMTIYRIVQESLTNTLRYAVGARHVEVAVRSQPDMIEIRVCDDAPSADVNSMGSRRGLLGIAARASSYGGTSSAGPLPAGGWETRATLHPDAASEAQVDG